MTGQNGTPRTALIHGCGSTLGRAVALELASRKIRLALYEPGPAAPVLREIQSEVQAAAGKAGVLSVPLAATNGEEGLVQAAVAQLGHLDVLVNLFAPRAQSNPAELAAYPAGLLARGLAAGRVMAAARIPGAIVNHCFLPAMYAGTKFDDYMPLLRGAITGITRSLCRQFGPAGIRANCVQTGLVDMPETKELASPEVLRVKVPVGRWGRPVEVARLIAYLALEGRYITGQALVLDGGLTAGITGT